MQGAPLVVQKAFGIEIQRHEQSALVHSPRLDASRQIPGHAREVEKLKIHPVPGERRTQPAPITQQVITGQEIHQGRRVRVAVNRAGRIRRNRVAFGASCGGDGQVVGYAANVLRCDEQRFNKLIPAIHMTAIERFRPEGAEALNLALAPFVNLDQGRFNDDRISRVFFRLSERYGNSIYNFRGLSFHKSKYRGQKKYLYYASNRWMPSVDIYLAFRAADITQSYFTTVGRVMWGMVEGLTRRRRNEPS